MKKLHDLNDNELIMVWSRNSKLREEAFEKQYEVARMWVNEYIECFNPGSIDYIITECERHSFIEILDIDEFLDGLLALNNVFDFFNDEFGELIDKAIKLNELKWEIHDIVNVEVINSLNENIEQLCQRPIKYIIERCCNEYSICYNDDELQHYFVNFMLDDMIEDGCYYLDDDFVLYEKIMKCYK